METELMEVRDKSKLISSLDLAGDIITKDYLYQLKNYSICEVPDELEKLDVAEYSRLFKFSKIISDPNENMLEKMITVLNAAYSTKASVVTFIKGYEDRTDYYLGIVCKRDAKNIDVSTSGETFKGAIKGNFSGIEFSEMTDPDTRNILKALDESSYITSISGIPSLRDEEENDYEKYVQGIEHMVDALQGREYSVILIADPVSLEEINVTERGYETLYSQLSIFQSSTLSFNESETYTYSSSDTQGFTDTVGESIANTQGYSSTTGWSESSTHTESTTKNTGAAVGLLVGAGLAAATIATGGLASAGATAVVGAVGAASGAGATLGAGLIGSKTKSDSTTTSTSGSETNSSSETKTKSESKSTQNSTTVGASEGDTHGRNLQFVSDNKTVKVLLDKIDTQIERLDTCKALGAFNYATYVITSDPETNAIVSSSYNALMRGEVSNIQSSYINNWNSDESAFKNIKEYLKKLAHPMFTKDEFNYVVMTPATIVNSEELAIGIGLPKRSITGLPVVESVAFGRNVFKERAVEGKSINLGSIFHMGSKTNVKVDLDVNSLTMHTFVTGSTGAGKSNAIYSLLEAVMNKTDTHFMVIEPAKGEYKDKFGHLSNVRVLGTNKNKTDILRINPFSFPSDIHVLEHIDRLIEIFNVCWPMYAAMPAVLKDAIERSYINAGWDLMNSKCKHEKKYGQVIYPSFIDVLKMINVVMEESEYSADNKGDYTGALCTRVKSLTNGIYGQIFSNNEISNEELFDENIIVDLSRVGSVETKSLIMGLLIMKMQEYRMSSHNANNVGLNHLTVLEEAHNLLKKTSSDQSAESSNLLGKSVEMLANSIAEMRTYGEGFVIADQSPGLLDMSVIRNTNTKIILRLPDMSDRELVGRAASLNDNQIVELSKLKTGVAAVYQNDWLEPVLCSINKSVGDEVKYEYVPSPDYNYDEEQIKREVIDYLLLPAPKKLEVNTDIVSKLEKHVYKLNLSADVKTDILRYMDERDPENIHNIRRRIIYNMFGSKSALLISNTEKHDINSWYNLMLDNLDPCIDLFEESEKEMILAIIADENAMREKTQEAYDLRNGFLRTIKD